MINFITYFNNFSETKFYYILFFGFIFIYGSISYYLQMKNELKTNKCESILGNIILFFHHYFTIFLYIGFLIPKNKVLMYSIFIIFFLTFLNWILFNNFCILTYWENILCDRPKDRYFTDLIYYVFPNVDKWIVENRIMIIIIYMLILFLRYKF